MREQQACVVVLPEGLLQSSVEIEQLRKQLVLVQRAGMLALFSFPPSLPSFLPPFVVLIVPSLPSSLPGMNPLVLLTHVDLAYPSLRQDPSGRGVSDLQETKREAARQLGVEVNRVLHMVPYKDEETRYVSLFFLPSLPPSLPPSLLRF